MKENDVVLFKLVTNEEIIAKIVDLGTDIIELDDTVAVVYQQSEKGLSSGFAPFMPHSDGTVKLSRSAIVGIGKVHPDVLKNYNTLFSNIVVPNSKLVV